MESNVVDKLRKAIENSNGLLEELAAIGEWGESAREQIAENNAALALPRRQCDVGTADEQQERFNSFCNRCEDGCPLAECETIVECAITWEQIPYAEKGGAE